MKVRTNYLIRQMGLGDAASYVYNLDGKKPISAITLFFNATTNTPAGTAAALAAEIEDIQVVDGGRVICGGNGDLLHGMQYGLGHGLGVLGNSEVTTAERADFSLTLFFGRYIGDKEYFLDLTKLLNPQIRFNSNMAVGAGYFTTGTLVGSIIIHTLEDTGLTHKGTFTLKSIATEVIAATTDGSTELPVDHPWLALGAFLQTAAGVPQHPFISILNLKISQNYDEYVPFDMRIQAHCQENYTRLGAVIGCEQEWLDWVIKDNLALVMPNITLEALRYNPYGGVFVNFASPDKSDFWTPERNSVVRAIASGGATGASVRYMLAQVGE